MKKKQQQEIPLIKYAFKFGYLGLNYKGLQKQPKIKDTIEEQIFNAFYNTKLLLKTDDIKDLDYNQCGRTDKGVSSAGNVILIKIRIKKKDEISLLRRINSALPDDIHFYSACKDPKLISTRYQCLYREYKFFFYIEDLDIQIMKECAKLFIGENDFRHFCKMKPEYEKNGTIRKIQMCKIESVNNTWVNFLPVGVLTVRATGFLYHQIRCMIAILKAIGKSQIDMNTVKQMLKGDKKETYCYQMEQAESLVLYNCQFDNELVQFEQPSDYNKKFIKRFFSILFQKQLRIYYLLKTMQNQYEEICGEKDIKFKKLKKNFNLKKLKTNQFICKKVHSQITIQLIIIKLQ